MIVDSNYISNTSLPKQSDEPMAAELHQSGSYLDHTPVTNMAAGIPVDLGGGLVGIPPNDIAAGQLGSVAIAGVHKVPKGAIAFAVGAAAGYDATNDVAVAAGAGTFDMGTVVYAAATGDAAVHVLLNGKNM